MKIQNKDTVGEASLELQKKGSSDLTPIDIQKEVHAGTKSKRSYEEEVHESVRVGRQKYDGDFFIVVLLRRERKLTNVLRQLFFQRKSCPSPQYDQSVYHYGKNGDCLELQWVVPDKQTCNTLPHMRSELPSDQMWLLEYIDAYNSGQLDKRCLHLNKSSSKQLQDLKVIPN